MSRINNRKYNFLAHEFAGMLTAADEALGPTYYAKNFGSAIALVSDAHAVIQNQKCRELAREITDLGSDVFDKHSAFEAPSYYGYGSPDNTSVRGLTLDQAFKAIGVTEIAQVYWESLNAFEYFNNLDHQRFVMTIHSHIEYGNAPEDLQVLLKENSNGCIDRDYDNCNWNDETIMTEAEWDRLQVFIDENNINVNDESDLVWKETSGYDRATMLNLIEKLDEDMHNRWNGCGEDHDCILGRLEALNQEQPILALTVAQRIDQVIFNTKLSWSQRYTACENALARAERVA